jgi:dTDP-glucose 4,6-dehydratase
LGAAGGQDGVREVFCQRRVSDTSLEMQMKTVLVTGGAGFIGCCFVQDLIINTDYRVINLDALTYAGHLESLADVIENPRHVFVKGDIRNAPLVGNLLREYRPSAVVHLAAESHVDRSIGSPAIFVQTNVVGTFQLLEATLHYWQSLERDARARFRFLQVSTDEVYGTLGETGKFTETTPHAPNSPYSASKSAADHFARAFHHTYGLPVVTTNCSNNYGPFQFPEKLIPLMILNALENKPLPVYGDGANVRDWLYVHDHCLAMRLVLERGRVGEVYNIGGNAERTNLNVVETICRTVDRLRPGLAHSPCSSLIRFVTDRPGHDRRYAIATNKIERELGWAPQVSFEEGIERTVRWYLDHSDWIGQVTAGKHDRQRLGLLETVRPTTPEATVRPSNAAAVEYRDGPIDGVWFKQLERRVDQRGWFVEMFRADEIPSGFDPAMSYVSETLPNVARGPHEHLDQTDYFAFLGPGDFQLYLWDPRPTSPTYGNKIVRVVGESDPTGVIVPPRVVHAYVNVSQVPALVVNSPNRLYAGWGRQQPVDEIRHEDQPDSPFRLKAPKS